jgi:hypothetical protein
LTAFSSPFFPSSKRERPWLYPDADDEKNPPPSTASSISTAHPGTMNYDPVHEPTSYQSIEQLNILQRQVTSFSLPQFSLDKTKCYSTVQKETRCINSTNFLDLMDHQEKILNFKNK